MSFVKIWIHAVWSTKNREPLLEKKYRQIIFQHIYQNGCEKEILMDTVNGYIEHVHCLLRLKNDQTIKKTLQLLKGESSYWVNQQRILKSKLYWQNDYFAVSVGESQVDTVRKYILRQEEHHREKTFSQEYQEFIENYQFK